MAAAVVYASAVDAATIIERIYAAVSTRPLFGGAIEQLSLVCLMVLGVSADSDLDIGAIKGAIALLGNTYPEEALCHIRRICARRVRELAQVS